MPARPILVLGPLLRYTSEREAVIWTEMNQPGTIQVRLLRFGQPSGSSRTHTVRIGIRHYALIALDHLQPGTWYEYELDFVADGTANAITVWPDAFLRVPRTTFRTLPRPGEDLRITFLSCRSMQTNPDRGVDALLAWALQLRRNEALRFFRWPNLLLMIGDQMYADELSEDMKRRLGPIGDPKGAAASASGGFLGGLYLRPNQLLTVEEFCAGYVESWRAPDLRWAMSCISSLTIFDDHEIVDDWNLSESWLSQQKERPYWISQLRAGLIAYWLYQGAGNLPPSEWERDRRMRPFREAASGRFQTGTAALQGEFSRIATGTRARFSYVVDHGPVRIVVGDCRSRRVLESPLRLMMDEDEWAWFVRQCTGSPHPYLLVVLSLPAFLPLIFYAVELGVEGLSLSPPVLAFLGELARQELDIEHWSAFPTSFQALINLLRQLAGEGERPAKKLVALISGDVHFTYNMEIQGMGTAGTTELQLVSSPSRMKLKARQAGFIQAGQRLSMAPASFGGLRWDPLQTPNGWLWIGNFIGSLRVGLGSLFVSYELAGLAKIRTESGAEESQPTLMPLASFRRQI